MTTDCVPCWIYRSPRKPEMYLYIAQEGIFDCIPSELLAQFGTPELVIQLDLHTDRALAREDVELVMANLMDRGFHLQMPPKLDPFLYRGG